MEDGAHAYNVVKLLVPAFGDHDRPSRTGTMQAAMEPA